MTTKAKRFATEHVGFRVGARRRIQFQQLTRQAGLPKPTHLMVALIDHLSQIKGNFDVRDLAVMPRGFVFDESAQSVNGVKATVMRKLKAEHSKAGRE